MAPNDSAHTRDEELFRRVVEAAPNALLLIDPAGEIVMANDAAAALFGYARAEMLGLRAALLVPPRLRDASAATPPAFSGTGRTRPFGALRGLFGIRRDGREFAADIALNPIATDRGSMILASIVDISGRQAVEAALRDGEHRVRSLAAIVESSDDAIIGETLTGIIVSWNRAAERVFGYAAEDIIGQPISRLAVPGSGDDMMEILDRIKNGERVDHYETFRRHRDGSIRHVSLSVSPIYDFDGRLVGASKVARDITAAKLSEAALRETENRLQELNAELLHVSRLSAMGQMAATVTHELNQPLTAIANYLSAAQVFLDRGGEAPLPRIRDAVARAAEQALRAGQIIQRLRGFVARGDSEKRIEAVAPLIREAAELALIGTRNKGFTVAVSNEAPGICVIADKIQVQQVLLNLLRNAAEAVADGTDREITLDAEARDGVVQFSVIDRGPGLSPEIQAKLFQPFVSTKKTGMGVGLSISRSIVTGHNGELWAEPNPAGGTIFRFTLPVATVRDESAAPAPAPQDN